MLCIKWNLAGIGKGAKQDLSYRFFVESCPWDIQGGGVFVG